MTKRTQTLLSVVLGIVLLAAVVWAGQAWRVEYNDGAAESARRGESAAGETGAVPADQWVVVKGTVVSHEENELVIRTDSGEEIAMGLGPLGYWLGHGIALHPGDALLVRGFYTDAFEPAEIENMTTGESVTLRDAEGSPLWRGAEH